MGPAVLYCTALARQRYVALGGQNGRSCGLCGERILCMFGEQQQGLARKSDIAVNVEGRVGQPSQNRRFWRRCRCEWEAGSSCGLCGERILPRFVEPQHGLARGSDAVVEEGRRCGVAIAEPTGDAGGGLDPFEIALR